MVDMFAAVGIVFVVVVFCAGLVSIGGRLLHG